MKNGKKMRNPNPKFVLMQTNTYRFIAAISMSVICFVVIAGSHYFKSSAKTTSTENQVVPKAEVLPNHTTTFALELDTGRVDYVHPKHVFLWIIKEKNATFWTVPISTVSIGGNPFMVSTKAFKGEPDNFGRWQPSANGAQIAFAPIKGEAFSENGLLPEIYKAQNNRPATVRSVSWKPSESGATETIIDGELTLITDKAIEETKSRLTMLQPMSPAAVKFSTRRTDLPLITVKIGWEDLEKAKDSVGALVWQDNHPVGIVLGWLGAKSESHLNLFAEPILESAKLTLGLH